MIKRFISNLHYKLFKSYIENNLGRSKAHDRLVIGAVTRILVDKYTEDSDIDVIDYIKNVAMKSYKDA